MLPQMTEVSAHLAGDCSWTSGRRFCSPDLWQRWLSETTEALRPKPTDYSGLHLASWYKLSWCSCRSSLTCLPHIRGVKCWGIRRTEVAVYVPWLWWWPCAPVCLFFQFFSWSGVLQQQPNQLSRKKQQLLHRIHLSFQVLSASMYHLAPCFLEVHLRVDFQETGPEGA